MKTCHSCKNEVSIGRSVGRRDVCSSCGADLHCCLNCRFYDPSVSKQCREPAAELVKEKAKANYCDFFAFTESNHSDRQHSDIDQVRKAFNGLFKK